MMTVTREGNGLIVQEENGQSAGAFPKSVCAGSQRKSDRGYVICHVVFNSTNDGNSTVGPTRFNLKCKQLPTLFDWSQGS